MRSPEAEGPRPRSGSVKWWISVVIPDARTGPAASLAGTTPQTAGSRSYAAVHGSGRGSMPDYRFTEFDLDNPRGRCACVARI
jgi:hypothetical protein